MKLKTTNSYFNFFILLSIFLINFLAKIFHIGSSSFWHDEILSVKNTLLEFGHIKHESEWDANPPFYYYALWVWRALFGDTEIAIRSLSAFFSALSAVVVYILSRRRATITWSIVITLLYSFHPYLIYYAQEARCYAMLTFLVALNVLFTENVLKNSSYLNVIILGFFNFLLFYTHYLVGILLLFQAIILLIHYRNEIFKWALLYLIPLSLVLLRFTKKQYNVLFFSSDLSKEKNNVSFSNFDTLWDSITGLYGNGLLFFLFLVVTTWLLFRKQNSNQTKSNSFLTIYVAVLPIFCIITLYLLGFYTNVFATRYLAFILPVSFMSLSFLPPSKMSHISIFCVAAIVFIPKIQFGVDRKMNYRLVAELCKKLKLNNSEDAIVIQTHDLVPLFTYYFDHELFENKDRSNSSVLKSYGIYSSDNSSVIEQFPITNKNRIVLLQTFQKREDNLELDDFFMSLGYSKWSTRGISGVRFSVFFKNVTSS